MPAAIFSMRQRARSCLKFSTSLPTREIARRLGLAPSTVRETLSRLEGAGLSWPLPEGIGDAGLRPRSTPIAGASEDTAATPSRIGRRSIGS